MIKSKQSLKPVWKYSRAISLLFHYKQFNHTMRVFMNNIRQYDLVRELRQKTGMRYLDCDKCLRDNNWNIDAALLKWRDYDTANKPLINWRDQVK